MLHLSASKERIPLILPCRCLVRSNRFRRWRRLSSQPSRLKERSPQPRTTPDHVFLHAILRSGVPLGIEVAGGGSPEALTRFEIFGTQGTLTLQGGAMRGVQSGRLQLLLNDEPQHLEEGEVRSMPEPAANVARVYAMQRDDIANGTHLAPDFAHAVRLARFLDAVHTSSDAGMRQAIPTP